MLYHSIEIQNKVVYIFYHNHQLPRFLIDHMFVANQPNLLMATFNTNKARSRSVTTTTTTALSVINHATKQFTESLKHWAELRVTDVAETGHVNKTHHKQNAKKQKHITCTSQKKTKTKTSDTDKK